MTFSPSPAPLEEDLNDEFTENDHDIPLVESDIETFDKEDDALEGVQFNTFSTIRYFD